MLHVSQHWVKVYPSKAIYTRGIYPTMQQVAITTCLLLWFMYYWLGVEEGQLEDQLKNWINLVHQFFTHTFFPVYEHSLVLKKELQEEQQRQTTDNRITLEKAKANAKYVTIFNLITCHFDKSNLHFNAN